MKFVEKRQNRPSGIRLSGVPPYNAYKNLKKIDNGAVTPTTIYKNSKKIERTLLSGTHAKFSKLSKKFFGGGWDFDKKLTR